MVHPLILTIIVIVCLAIAIYATQMVEQIKAFVGLIIALECMIAIVVILSIWGIV